jgi:hypothetical protein
VATQSRELKVGRPTLSLSEVSLSELSMSSLAEPEVSMSSLAEPEVSGSWGRSAIATGTSCYGPGRTRRPNSAAQGLRRRLAVTARGDGSANATAAEAYWRSGAAVHRETTGLLSTGLLSTGLLSTRPTRGLEASAPRGSAIRGATPPDALDLRTVACSDGAEPEMTTV